MEFHFRFVNIILTTYHLNHAIAFIIKLLFPLNYLVLNFISKFPKVLNIILSAFKFNLKAFKFLIYHHLISSNLLIVLLFLNYLCLLRIFGFIINQIVHQLIFIINYLFDFLNLESFFRGLTSHSLMLQHFFLVLLPQAFIRSFINHLIFVNQVIEFEFLIFNSLTLID